VYLVSNTRLKYAKTLVALLGTVFTILSPYLANGLHNLSPDEWLLVLGSFGTAVGVYIVPNQPPFAAVEPYDPTTHGDTASFPLPTD
jgi:hypothetical protein